LFSPISIASFSSKQLGGGFGIVSSKVKLRKALLSVSSAAVPVSVYLLSFSVTRCKVKYLFFCKIIFN